MRLLTEEAGLIKGYVRGGRSTRLRPVLMPGNSVKASWRARAEDQMGQLTAELDRGASTLMFGQRLAGAALSWVMTLSAVALPERQPYARLFQALDGLVQLMLVDEEPRRWLSALVRYELLLLRELGFGLDLSCCASTGQSDSLVYVSPKSGRAVSREAGAPWQDQLLALPGYLIRQTNGWPDWSELDEGLALTGHFLWRDILSQHLHADRPSGLEDGRDRLVRLVQQAGNAADTRQNPAITI